MHEEIKITTTTTSSATSNFCNNTIVNSSNLHQNLPPPNSEDNTITVVVHPHQGNFMTTSSNSSCPIILNQIVSSQTKILVDGSELKDDDISSVIMNGSNVNDPNVLILPPPETCDSEKEPLNISQLTTAAEQIDIDLQDVADETSSRDDDGEFTKKRKFFLLILRFVR
jgi:hypothetical protein